MENKKITSKKLITYLVLIVLTGMVLFYVGSLLFEFLPESVRKWVTIVVLVIVASFIKSVYDESYSSLENKKKIERLEREVIEKPTEVKTSWELARLKLESYFNRNLRQVSSIYFLSLVVMSIGFSLIVYGVYRVFNDPKLMSPAILASCSGIVVNFIGGTFLFIYRSTLKQAKNYVDVLERINAVGMALQILDSISNEKKELKDETTAEIAKELLKIYGELRLKSGIEKI